MKIIIKQPDFSTNCINCGCKFIFEKEDILDKKSTGGPCMVTCPICNNLIKVFKSNIRKVKH